MPMRCVTGSNQITICGDGVFGRSQQPSPKLKSTTEMVHQLPGAPVWAPAPPHLAHTNVHLSETNKNQNLKLI